MKKLPFIQILTGLYISAIALYMLFNYPSEAWKNYYWIVNKTAMLIALSFNYKKDKTKIDWLFINFLTVQTLIIILYFSFGLPYFYRWMQINDAVIYSFFIGGFIALLAMWGHFACVHKNIYACITNWFRSFRDKNKKL